MPNTIAPRVDKRRGLILMNLGTPDAPTIPAVRSYLREFLMDPSVIDLPWPARAALVYGVILPRRPRASAEAYAKVWTAEGSPLKVHLLGLTALVQEALGPQWRVQPAMRYKNPSLELALEALRAEEISQLTLMPLYPQYSLAATESSIKLFHKLLKKMKWEISVHIVPPFYEHPLYIQELARTARLLLEQQPFDHVLFSFHGLPERQLRKTPHTPGECLSGPDCCARIHAGNQNCYRAQCFRTAHRAAQALGLSQDRYTVCFQSRLGVTPWIKPYTDELYTELPKRGLKRVIVLSPAFVADCLETLEELQIRGAEDFVARGGEWMKLVPSLNSGHEWAQAVATLATTASGPEGKIDA